jgi:hypothetical protein
MTSHPKRPSDSLAKVMLYRKIRRLVELGLKVKK